MMIEMLTWGLLNPLAHVPKLPPRLMNLINASKTATSSTPIISTLNSVAHTGIAEPLQVMEIQVDYEDYDDYTDYV